MTRQLFEELTEDLLHRTSYTTRQVLSAAGCTWDELDRVLLVGGSTRMPMVARMLEELSGLTPDRSVNPDEAVAHGAAIYAGHLISLEQGSDAASTLRVVNVNSHSLGIEATNRSTNRRENVIIIPRNTPLPAARTRRCATKFKGQQSVEIKVLEGESCATGPLLHDRQARPATVAQESAGATSGRSHLPVRCQRPAARQSLPARHRLRGGC